MRRIASIMAASRAIVSDRYGSVDLATGNKRTRG
jgi:hypothetical protein